MENKVLWHYRSPNKEELDLAINEINKMRDNFIKALLV